MSGPVRAGAIILAAAASLLLPLWLSVANLTVYILTGLYAVTAIGLSVLMGYAGQVSLGQAVFFAIGAYTAAVLSVIANTAFLGGGLGFTAIPSLGLGGAALTSPRGYAWLVWGVTAVVMILTLNLIRSRPGRALRALATSEATAESAGIPVVRYKLAVFALSAAYAGFAGGIYVFFIGYAAPGAFSVQLSVELVVMVVIFGLGSVWGALLGAVGISILVQVLNNVGTLPGMPQYMPTLLSYAAYGVILVLIMVFLPEGLQAITPPDAVASARSIVSSLRLSSAKGGGKPPSPEQQRRQ